MVASSGLYGITLKKQLIDTLGKSYESTTDLKVLMVTNTYSENFDTHDFANDVTNEVSGTGYTAGGAALGSPSLTVGSPAAGQLKYDASDVSWASSTITNARAAIGYVARGGASSADELLFLSNFGSDASTSNGTFTIQWHANGIFYIDY